MVRERRISGLFEQLIHLRESIMPCLIFGYKWKDWALHYSTSDAFQRAAENCATFMRARGRRASEDSPNRGSIA